MNEDPSAERTDFAAVLKRLLNKEQVSVRALAERTKIPKSSIYRWLNRELHPPLRMGYHTRIANELELSPEEATELRDAVVVSSERGILKASRDKTRGEFQAKATAEVEKTTTALGIDPSDQDASAELLRGERAIPSTVIGTEAVLDMAIALLQRAAARPSGGDILLTLQGHNPLDACPPLLRTRWEAALRSLLGVGWNVTHLIRLEEDTTRTIEIAREILMRLGTTGIYEPRYFRKYGYPTPTQDFLVVPNCGAMILMATQEGRHIDAAIFLEDAKQIAALTQFVMQFSTETELLAEVFEAERPRFDQVIADVEDKIGDRYLVQGHLGALAKPASWYTVDSWWAKQRNATDGDLVTLIARRHRRLQAFEQHVQAYRYRDICSRQAIETTAREGLLTDHRRGKIVLDPPRRRELLENVVGLLRRHDKYELALIDKPEEDVTLHPWAVKGQAVLLETRRPQEPEKEPIDYDLVVTEATMAKGFRMYFEQRWTEIPPEYREKKDVIAWLEDLIANLS